MSLSRITARLAGPLGQDANHLYAVAMSVLRLIEQTTLVTGRFRIAGFGQFYTHQRPQRPARNPRTGEAAVVSQRCELRFREERSEAVAEAAHPGAAQPGPSPISRRSAQAGMRSELGRACQKVAPHFCRSPQEVLHLMTQVLAMVQDDAFEQGRCTVRGFGTFHVTTTKTRMARNPLTGEPVPVPSRQRLSFRHGADRAQALDRLGSAFFAPRPVRLPHTPQSKPEAAA
jgi:integration host factor subunit beta